MTVEQLGKRYRRAKNHPLKASASRIYEAALRSGELSKPLRCQGCGADGVLISGHHEDYAEPLAVEFLCRGCHSKRHMEPRLPSLKEVILKGESTVTLYGLQYTVTVKPLIEEESNAA